MGSIDESILKATKEIIVKFIEAGRLSPASFHSTFKEIYQTVTETVKVNNKTASLENEENQTETKL